MQTRQRGVRRFLTALVAAAAGIVSGCGGGDESRAAGSPSPSPVPTYSVGGALTGLGSGKRVVLRNSGGNDLTLSANGSFAFTTALTSGSAYAVSVLTQPSGQTCTVSNGSGSISANVSNIAVACTDNPVATYSIGGSVSGLGSGKTLVLQVNGGDNLSLSANGSFTFATALSSGSAYAVTVMTQPAGQTCAVSSGTGTVGANVTNVAVACSDNPIATYTIGGTLSGLASGASITLRNNGGDDLVLSANGSFTFATAIAGGSSYAVTVLSQPGGQACTVSSGAGTANANVTGVRVSCITNVPGPVRTLYVNAACGTAGNGSADTCGGANGALRTLTAAHAASLPGDVIRVRSGTYDERIVFSRGGNAGSPVRWQTYGDGPVTWVNTNTSSSQPGINDWTGALIYAPASPGASFVSFEGSAGNEWIFQGANSSLFYSGAIVLYGDAAATRTTDWSFKHVVVRNGTGRAGTLAGWRYTFEDFTITNNGSGFTVLAAANAHMTTSSRPWSGHVFRRGRMTNNGSGGNNDGLIIQDIDGVLVEDCEFSGQYDGFDSGSQTMNVPGAPGPRWVIARFNRATGSNGVMPASTVHQGPVTMVYNAIYDNGNWGAVPVYEGSGNVHLWHNTFVNNAAAVNFQSPTTGPLHLVNNLCVASANSTSRNGVAMKICLDGNGQTVVRRTNYLAGTVHYNPAALDTTEQSGAAGSVSFADTSRYYPLATANPALVDRGEYFFRTAQAGTNTTTLVTGASYTGGPSDPRTFFWVGDTVQIAGVGTRTVVALSATAITLDAPATFPAGAGVHYPFVGSAPDMGRSEWGGPRR